MTETFITNKNITQDILNGSPSYPLYTSQIMNLANQNAQGTRPRVVGQMSELIQKFPGKKYEDWVNWYTQQEPDAIDIATQKILQMIQNFKTAVNSIDEKLVRQWVTDLVLTKTFVGLCFQESILRRISEDKKTTYRLATPSEEAQGIDGYIGEMPVSIVPSTYNSKKMLPEKIEVEIIYYEKKKDGISVNYSF